MRSGFIALIGRPNAGKSTLLNQILGSEISIVSPKAQTTRERVLGILTEAQGQMIFVDTPGIHRAQPDGINAAMMNEAKTALDHPSAIWYLVDPQSGPKPEGVVLETLAAARAFESPVFLILNKIDRTGSELKDIARGLLESLRTQLLEYGYRRVEIFELSALKGKGLTPLLQATWAVMPEGPLYYPDADQLSDRPMRFFVAEKIREQLFSQLGEELPYSCAVEITRFDEKTRPVRIEATILVERESQKPMVIGAKGQKIKEIGMAARENIEAFLDGQKIFLGLTVKVLPNWTRDPAMLERMGYVR